MSVENKFAKFMRNTGVARFLVPFGIVMIVFGAIMSGFNTDTFEETVGKVTDVYEHIDATDQGKEKKYDISFSYTVGGKQYDGLFADMPEEMKVGDDIKVYYDPADPNRATNAKIGKFVGPAIMGAGVLVIAYGVFTAVKAFKKSRELDAKAPAAESVQFDGFKTAPGVTEIYVRFDGNGLKPGYIMEDADRNVLYEGKMVKQALVGARPYEFVNHVTGTVQTHEVGHVMTQSFNNEFFSTKSWFKFDGRNVWDVLHDSGMRLETDLVARFPNLAYNLSRDGRPVARIETSGMYVHEDEAAQHAVNLPIGRYYYRIWTNAEDLDALFLTVFAISETEQTVVE